MNPKIRTIKQISMIKDEWVNLDELNKEDIQMLCKRHPDMKIHFKKEEVK